MSITKKTFLTKTLSAVAIAGGIAAGVFGSAVPASAEPPPPPVPVLGEPVPNWAPPKPAEVWEGQPIVWTSGWGGRWGVWLNGQFMPLSSNPVTGGG